VPREARRLLEECLQKDPKQRLRDIGDAKRLMESGASSDAVTVPLGGTTSRRLVAWIAAAAAVLAIGLVGVSWIAYRATRPVERPLMRLTDDLDAEVFLDAQNGPAVAISPNGARLAYVSRGSDGKTHLSARLLESSKSTALSGTEGAAAPFFSPDSRWIAFFADQKLKKISVEGGAAVTLCDAASARGAFWGEDGNILFSSQRTPLMRVSSSGGTPHPANGIR